MTESGASMFEDYSPAYYSIFTDNKGRIYVQTNKTQGQSISVDMQVDIFSKEGYYLHTTTLPYHLHIIKNGYFYTYFVNEDTGEELVKRFRIKNWEQIKEGR